MKYLDKIICIVIVPCLLLLSGCWDQVEIELRATVVGLAIDQADHHEIEEDYITHPEYRLENIEGLYKITAQLAVPGQVALGPEEGGTGGSVDDNVWVVEGYGYTIGAALQSIQQKLAHELFFGHLQVIIVSDATAKEGLADIDDYFQRRNEIRRTIWLAISKGDAATTMAVSPKLEQIPAIYLSTTLDHAVELGKFPEKRLGDFWINQKSLGEEAMLPYIEIDDNNIRIGGMAYFKGTKLINMIEPYQVVIYNAVTGFNPSGANIMFPIEDGHVLAMSRHRDVDYQIELDNGRPKIDVHVSVHAEIREKSDAIELNRAEDVERLNQQTEKIMEKDTKLFLQQMQQEQTDVFGFGEQVRARLPEYWDTHVQTNTNWQQLFSQITINVNYDINFDRIGIKSD
ncbi:Ger(x)C family spore germination protein [Amphibacillus cookii]|uniref:Ger(x)C family spore germination protein n=1 Tax=Amphibacillus cookii TaxID=767787 RepID=UPI00195E3AAD|nr:Ger(x)C family spore germination protein [Amphibacillus cookii]MBM7539806.1 spore germination protein KC [Amphibacillus cookii]